METIQVVLDKPLLQAANRAAKQLKRNRSALVRDALREHLRRLEIRAQEEHERAAYKAHPQDLDEARLWETVAVWPED
jgi:metal-responsive CopG/Arc/MetJ family transcriptional regulator